MTSENDRLPVWIPCEGSNCRTNLPTLTDGLCQMCGATVTLVYGKAEPHRRKDITAMIDRGDFGD